MEDRRKSIANNVIPWKFIFSNNQGGSSWPLCQRLWLWSKWTSLRIMFVNPKIGLGQISTQQPPRQWVAYVVLESTMPGETFIGHPEHEYALNRQSGDPNCWVLRQSGQDQGLRSNPTHWPRSQSECIELRFVVLFELSPTEQSKTRSPAHRPWKTRPCTTLLCGMCKVRSTAYCFEFSVLLFIFLRLFSDIMKQTPHSSPTGGARSTSDGVNSSASRRTRSKSPRELRGWGGRQGDL